eukprot:scaffold418_cov386-Prasinococcus_capsulatus_cf.AAC.20
MQRPRNARRAWSSRGAVSKSAARPTRECSPHVLRSSAAARGGAHHRDVDRRPRRQGSARGGGLAALSGANRGAERAGAAVLIVAAHRVAHQSSGRDTIAGLDRSLVGLPGEPCRASARCKASGGGAARRRC